MMTKILEIRTCFECPNYREDVFAFYCKGAMRQLKKEEVYLIASWCPLPDKKEEPCNQE